MLKIRRFYNQNRKTIWICIIVFLLIIIILRFLNNLSKNKENSSSQEPATTVNNNYSIISNKEININDAESINNVLKKFFDNCNNGKTKEAYELLSKDCKQELYKNENEFEENYIKKMFKTTKIYSSQAWSSSDIGETYRIEISEDFLSSGNLNSESTETYFTFVKENDNYRININDYIGKEEINKVEEYENIEITVISRQIYMDYAKYKIKVKNKTDKPILLDGFIKDNSMYLLDNKGGKKVAFLNEITPKELLVQSNLTITKEIKFNRAYSTDLRITTVVFEDIILNYNEYKKVSDKKNYDNTLKFEIDV